MSSPTRATLSVSAGAERPRSGAPAASAGRPIPFQDAQEAWFWTMAALVARRERSPRGVDGAGPPRPALPEDVLRCLNRLYQDGRIDLMHARILRLWGERGLAPDLLRVGQRRDARLWHEALDRLEWPLRVCGIIGDHPDVL